MSEILGFEIDNVSFLLQMSKKTICQYVRKFRMLGHVDTAVMGRPLSCVAMHPHEELAIMEVLPQHPEKTFSEVLHEVYEETGLEYACSTLFYYLKRNNFTRKKVGILQQRIGIHVLNYENILCMEVH